MTEENNLNKNYAGWIFLVAFIFIIILISGSDDSNPGFQAAKSTVEIESKFNPTNIRLFSSSEEGDIIRFYFLLEDASGRNVPGDGKATFQIKDPNGKAVFTRSFNFRSSDFVSYQFQLTGQDVGKVYEWRVNKNDIEKGTASVGSADINIVSANGVTMKASDSYISIPSYTSEELEEIYENKYSIGSRVIGKTIKEGSFEVTLVKLGYYPHLKYGSSGDEVTDFRVDLSVKNIGAEKSSLTTYGAVLIAGSNQYEYSFGSNLDSSNIYPGVIKEGYLLFKDVPQNVSGPVKIVVGSSYGYLFDQFSYEFNVNI